MTPEQLSEFADEYENGELPDSLLAAKWNLPPPVFDMIVRTGRGTPEEPQPLERTERARVRGVKLSSTVQEIARQGELMPRDLALSPLAQAGMLSAEQRQASYHLSKQETEFANMVLRGMNTTAAACAAFEMYDKNEASRKASTTLRADHVKAYIDKVKGQGLYAPVRGKSYLEAVLWQVIDRSMELEQVYDAFGRAVPGKCDFNAKAVIAASVALMKLKGWGNDNERGGGQQLSHVERLRMINLNKKG